MTSSEIVRRDRWRVIPLPVVVDADVLSRSVDYAVRQGWEPAVVGRASGDYTSWTGVVVFATETVFEETLRRFPEIAAARSVPVEVVEQAWDDYFGARVRIVDVTDGLVDDPRVDGVRELDAEDAKTAELAVLLAPCVLLTDNRKHFRPFGLPDRDTTEVAVEVWHLGEFLQAMSVGTLPPRLAGLAVIEGGRALVRWLGRDGALLVALLLLGGAALAWRTESGRRVRASLGDALTKVAAEVGPGLSAAYEQGMAVADRLGAFAVEPGEPSPLAVVARRLAVSQPIMTTAEIAYSLRMEGYGFTPASGHKTTVRAWLLANPCFWEMRRGNWTLGYHPLPLLEG